MLNNSYKMEELYPLLLEVIESGGEFRLWPRGTSMRPLLREGKDSVALVLPNSLHKRDICLYRRADGAFVLHRLMKFDGEGEPVFCGDNQTSLEYGVKREQVIACACAVFRGEKRISLQGFRYRTYTRIWGLLPLRWLWLLPRRVVARLKKR